MFFLHHFSWKLVLMVHSSRLRVIFSQFSEDVLFLSSGFHCFEKVYPQSNCCFFVKEIVSLWPFLIPSCFWCTWLTLKWFEVWKKERENNIWIYLTYLHKLVIYMWLAEKWRFFSPIFSTFNPIIHSQPVCKKMPVKDESKPVSLKGMMGVLVQAHITKCHKLDGLKATEIYFS